MPAPPPSRHTAQNIMYAEMMMLLEERERGSSNQPAGSQHVSTPVRDEGRRAGV
jgi:hypothetical protein